MWDPLFVQGEGSLICGSPVGVFLFLNGFLKFFLTRLRGAEGVTSVQTEPIDRGQLPT